MLISDVSKTTGTGTGTAKAVPDVRGGALRTQRCSTYEAVPYILGFGVSCFHTYVGRRFSGATVVTYVGRRFSGATVVT